MKKIKNSRNLNVNDSSIEFKYEGIIHFLEMNEDKMNDLIDDFINNHNHNNMLENITIIRTILKGCEEKLLYIYYCDINGSELVKYNDAHMVLYEKSKKEQYDKYYDRYKVKYELDHGIKIDYNNHEYDVDNCANINLLAKEIMNITSQIYHLEKAKSVTLDDDSKELIEIYRLFYNEDLDFSSKDIHIKIQTMMSILGEFGIALGDDYTFNLCGSSKIPMSINLKQLVNKLYPFGKVDNVGTHIKLKEGVATIVNIVGECIRETIGNQVDLNDNLITISKIIHASRYNLLSNGDVGEISEFTNRTDEEVESSMKLVKRIEKKIKKR